MQNSRTLASKAWSFIALLGAANTVFAGLQRDHHVQYELLSEATHIAPGSTVTLGLRILHDEGWHTYWKQPGIAGIPTQFEWDLPEGFEAGPILWQQPQKTKMAVYTVYGYEGEAVLLTEITAPEDLPLDSEVTFKTKITWMMCAKKCVPSTTDAEITLKTGKAVKLDEDLKAEFDALRLGFPRESPSWKSEAQIADNTVTLRVEKQGDGSIPAFSEDSPPYFFCADGVIHSDAKQIAEKSGDSALVFTLERSKFAPENP
ncbi:MAG: protein-disulfide reductase DsbD domain-containing protein, partial [Verrucomicrobiota bacterium]